MAGGVLVGQDKHVFPSYFPDNCPPDEATDEEKLLFRLCPKSELTEKDFLSYYNQDPQKWANNTQAYGLSVLESKEDCERARRKNGKLRKLYPFSASGMNNSDRGKILNTPSYTNPRHFTWWVYEGVKPHTFFTIIDEGGGNNE